jgi:glycosyltransferase involved in cell wall biosynthesis
MRVLLVSSSSGSRGGGEFFLVYLGEALRRLGVEPVLWLSSDTGMDDLAAMFASSGQVIRHPYVNTYSRRSRSFSHLLPGGRGVRSILDSWSSVKPDIIHLNKQCLEDGLDLLQAAAEQGRPHGCTIHITQTAVELRAFLARARDWIARRALTRYPGKLWAISEQRAEELGAFVGLGGPVPYIPNGVRIPSLEDIGKTRHSMRERIFSDKPPAGPVAVSVGRLEEQKDPFRFLEILAKWKSVEPGLRGVWVGDGRLRASFEGKIDSMGAGSWIQCAGWQSDPLPYLCMADVYVHPARFEGLPFALLEAMAHGLPCVLSPSLAAELKDMPQDTWIIAGADSGKWCTALCDRDLLAGLGNRARQLAIDAFSIEAMAKAYIGLYEGLLQKDGEGVS